MRTAPYGRVLFGVSAVLFGVIALMWHDADTWQSVFRILSLPLGTAIGNVLMIAQIAGGLALLYPGTARRGSMILGVVYAIFSLTCIPGIIAHPKVFGVYDGFFEQFCFFCGALGVYASTEANAERATTFGRIARIGLGLCTISFTLAQVVYLQPTADLVPKWIPPNQMFWAILTTVAFALAAIAILIDRQARLAMRLMSLMIAIFGLLVWVPHLVASPQTHNAWSEFAFNYLIAGIASLVSDLKSF